MSRKLQSKKRGRPPIIKDYLNPLESPMALSSMIVQRQGIKNFTKPLMKVTQFSSIPKSSKRINVANNVELLINNKHNNLLVQTIDHNSPSITRKRRRHR